MTLDHDTELHDEEGISLVAKVFQDSFSMLIVSRTKKTPLVAVLTVSACMILVSLFLLYDVNDLETLLLNQIPMIQNLIHASLLGAAAFVTAFRGDVIWFLFCRNVAFFFSQVAVIFLFGDLVALRDPSSQLWNTLRSRIVIAGLFLVSSTTALILFERIRSALYGILQNRASALSYTNLPPGVGVGERSRSVRSTLSMCALLIQCHSIGYTALKLIQIWSNKESEDMNGSLSPFEKAYGLGAHQALLLSIIMLASFFTDHSGSIGGAILVSSWKLILATFTILDAVQRRLRNTEEADTFESVASMLLVTLEVLVMGVILIVSLQQAKLLSKQHHETEVDTPENVEAVPLNSNGMRLYLFASLLLYAELMCECLFLVSRSVFFEKLNHVLGWGMHTASIFIFCTIMALDNRIYGTARFLLAAACPGGSVIAIFQLMILQNSSEKSSWAICLLLTRAISGILQSIGLLLASTKDQSVGSNATLKVDQSPEPVCRQRAVFALYYVYLPCFLLYLALGYTSVWQGDSQTFSSQLVIADQHPFYGPIFHFGTLVVIFGGIATSTDKTRYRPSIKITYLFTSNAAILLGFDLLLRIRSLNALQTHSIDALLFISKSLFTMASIYVTASMRWLETAQQQQGYVKLETDALT